MKIPTQISPKCVLRSQIDNKPALVQVMAWRRTGDKPLPWTKVYSIHIYGTGERWVNKLSHSMRSYHICFCKLLAGQGESHQRQYVAVWRLDIISVHPYPVNVLDVVVIQASQIRFVHHCPAPFSRLYDAILSDLIGPWTIWMKC